MDFYRDFATILSNELVNNGYRIDPDWEENDTVDAYLNLLSRQIPIRPRVVQRSSELWCPSDHQLGLDEFLKKVTDGRPLGPHQSRALKKPEYEDGLFIDWGVHHFHLGTAIGRDGFATRSGPVLFAKVTADTFYAIQIYEHKNWTEQEVIQIIKLNWPEVIKPFELEGVQPLLPAITNEEVAALRAAGVSVFLPFGGKVIAPMGGGFVTTGASLNVIRERISIRKSCLKLQEQAAAIISSGQPPNLSAETMALRQDGQEVSIFDKITNLEISRSPWLIQQSLQ